MNGDVVVRDRNGVLLRYADPSVRRAQHHSRNAQPCDRERMSLIKAERELLTLQIVADHLDLSDIAMTRISDALQVIRIALQVKRREYGMQTDEMVAA
jgi:DNA-binding NtrC family response regulator